MRIPEMVDGPYRAFWSAEDGEWVGVCEAFPHLSHLDVGPEEALAGIRDLEQAVAWAADDDATDLHRPADARNIGQMNVNKTTSPDASTQTESPELPPRAQRPNAPRLESFLRDVGESLQSAEANIHDAFIKMRGRPSDTGTAAERTPLLPKPAAPAPAPAPSAAVPAGHPHVLQALDGIKGELSKLIDAHGGIGALAADGVQIIEGAIANPQREGAIVLADVAQIVAQMVSDLVLKTPPQSATAPDTVQATDNA